MSRTPLLQTWWWVFVRVRSKPERPAAPNVYPNITSCSGSRKPRADGSFMVIWYIARCCRQMPTATCKDYATRASICGFCSGPASRGHRLSMIFDDALTAFNAVCRGVADNAEDQVPLRHYDAITGMVVPWESDAQKEVGRGEDISINLCGIFPTTLK
eukprot:s111_g28.t1